MHPTRVAEWKKQLLEPAEDVFDGSVAGKADTGPDLKVLQAKIGQQALEIDFLGSSPKRDV